MKPPNAFNLSRKFSLSIQKKYAELKSSKHSPLWLHCKRLRDLWMWWRHSLDSCRSSGPSLDVNPKLCRTSQTEESVHLHTCPLGFFRKTLHTRCRVVLTPSSVEDRHTFVDLERQNSLITCQASLAVNSSNLSWHPMYILCVQEWLWSFLHRDLSLVLERQVWVILVDLLGSFVCKASLNQVKERESLK